MRAVYRESVFSETKTFVSLRYIIINYEAGDVGRSIEILVVVRDRVTFELGSVLSICSIV